MSFRLAQWAVQDLSSGNFADLLPCCNPHHTLHIHHAHFLIHPGTQINAPSLKPHLRSSSFEKNYFWITTWIISSSCPNSHSMPIFLVRYLLTPVFNSSACSPRVTPGLILFPHNLHILSMHYHFQNSVWYVHCSFLFLPGRKADSQFMNVGTTVPIYPWCDLTPWHSVWSLDKQ